MVHLLRISFVFFRLEVVVAAVPVSYVVVEHVLDPLKGELLDQRILFPIGSVYSAYPREKGS